MRIYYERNNQVDVIEKHHTLSDLWLSVTEALVHDKLHTVHMSHILQNNHV